eukprot:g40870.t1
MLVKHTEPVPVSPPAFSEAVKCEHERSIHLFIDSLLYKEQPCKTYRCNNPKSFEKGMCLNCHKNRCNTLGYDVKRVASKKSTRMYLKTRANMPFRVYHYQLKIHFCSKVNHFDIDPALSVSLHGTKSDVKDLPVEIYVYLSSSHSLWFPSAPTSGPEPLCYNVLFAAILCC